MRTRVTPVEELQKIATEVLMNKTSKVSKISDESTVAGITFGVAKIAQKAIKDIALIETYLFPDDASGDGLDDVGANNGISPRFQQGKSSTYLRVIGNPGTQYVVGVNTFTGSQGITFELEETVTIPAVGFTYASVKSRESGLKTNVAPLTIDTVTPVPSGHKYVINEYRAQNGRDIEQDEFFRRRIKNAPNINAQKTLSFLEQLFLTVNSNILRVFFYGINFGKNNIGIATQNGVSLTDNELQDIITQVGDRLCISDLKDFTNQLNGIVLRNIDYEPIDLDFRVMLDQSIDSDQTRINIQLKLQQKLDYRFWEEGDSISWDSFFDIVFNTKGIKNVPNKYFRINGGLNDILISREKLPRLRSFVMRDVQGNVIVGSTGSLLPIFYPNDPNQVFTETVI